MGRERTERRQRIARFKACGQQGQFTLVGCAQAGRDDRWQRGGIHPGEKVAPKVRIGVQLPQEFQRPVVHGAEERRDSAAVGVRAERFGQHRDRTVPADGFERGEGAAGASGSRASTASSASA